MFWLVVIRVSVALYTLRLCGAIGFDIHPDTATPTETIDIAEVNPPVQIERVRAEPSTLSV